MATESSDQENLGTKFGALVNQSWMFIFFFIGGLLAFYVLAPRVQRA